MDTRHFHIVSDDTGAIVASHMTEEAAELDAAAIGAAMSDDNYDAIYTAYECTEAQCHSFAAYPR